MQHKHDSKKFSQDQLLFTFLPNDVKKIKLATIPYAVVAVKCHYCCMQECKSNFYCEPFLLSTSKPRSDAIQI